MARKPKPETIAEPVEEITAPEVEEMEELPGGVTLPVPKARRGRPVYKYNPQYAIVARAMISKGATISELADVFGVTNSCVWKWRQTYDEFGQAFEELGNVSQRVEYSLLERALGYTYDAVKIFNYKGIPVVVPYKEHVPPDVNAALKYLQVYNPDRWRIKEEVEFTGDEAFKELFLRMGAKDKETK
jgi:hypothetical protein